MESILPRFGGSDFFPKRGGGTMSRNSVAPNYQMLNQFGSELDRRPRNQPPGPPTGPLIHNNLPGIIRNPGFRYGGMQQGQNQRGLQVFQGNGFGSSGWQNNQSRWGWPQDDDSHLPQGDSHPQMRGVHLAPPRMSLPQQISFFNQFRR